MKELHELVNKCIKSLNDYEKNIFKNLCESTYVKKTVSGFLTHFWFHTISSFVTHFGLIIKKYCVVLFYFELFILRFYSASEAAIP